MDAAEMTQWICSVPEIPRWSDITYDKALSPEMPERDASDFFWSPSRYKHNLENILKNKGLL